LNALFVLQTCGSVIAALGFRSLDTLTAIGVPIKTQLIGVWDEVEEKEQEYSSDG